MRAHTHFILSPKLIAVLDLIRREELSSCAMFNDEVFVGSHRLSNRGDAEVRIGMYYLPDCVIDVLCHHADFLIAREASKGKRADLTAVKISLLSEKMSS